MPSEMEALARWHEGCGLTDPRYGATRIGRTSSGVFLSNGFGVVLAFGNSIFLTRTLGVTGRGEFAIFSASFGLLSLLLGFGLDQSLRYHMARGLVAKERVLSSLVLFVAVVGVFVFATVHLDHVLFRNELFLPASKQTLQFELLLTGVVLSSLFYSGIAAVLGGHQQFTVLNVASVASSAVSVLVFGTLLWLKNGASPWIGTGEVFAAYLGLQLFNALVLTAVTFRIVGIRWSWSILERETFFAMLTYASLTYVANLAQFLSYRLDIWIVQYFAQSKALGLYSLAGNLAMMFWILPRSVSPVLLLAMASRESDVSMAQAARVARLLTALNVLIALPVAMTASWWLPFLYGADFTAAAWPFTLLLIGCVPFVLCVVQAAALSGINRVDVPMKASVAGLVVTLVLDMMLIPRYGINGAAVASAVSYIVTTTYVAIYFARIASLPLRGTIVPVPDDLRYLISGFKNLLR